MDTNNELIINTNNNAGSGAKLLSRKGSLAWETFFVSFFSCLGKLHPGPLSPRCGVSA